MLNNLLKKALLPALYGYVFLSMIRLISSTYYLDDWVVDLCSAPLPFPEEIMTLSVSGMVKLVIAGVALHAMISSFKILLQQSLGDRAESGLAASFMTLGTYVIWFMFVLVLLFLLQVHYSSVLVILGGLSMGIGFAFKEVLENFISGLIILIGQQVLPGDTIEFDGIWAKVTKVSIRATVVESADGAILTFPNSQILTKNFRNRTSNNDYLRRDIKVGVSYGMDVAEVKRLLLETAAQIAPTPRRFPPPQVIFSDFGSSSLDFVLRLWLPAAKYTDLSTALRERIYKLFAEHNSTMPFPQLDVHFDPVSKKQEESFDAKSDIAEDNNSTEK